MQEAIEHGVPDLPAHPRERFIYIAIIMLLYSEVTIKKIQFKLKKNGIASQAAHVPHGYAF